VPTQVEGGKCEHVSSAAPAVLLWVLLQCCHVGLKDVSSCCAWDALYYLIKNTDKSQGKHLAASRKPLLPTSGEESQKLRKPTFRLVQVWRICYIAERCIKASVQQPSPRHTGMCGSTGEDVAVQAVLGARYCK